MKTVKIFSIAVAASAAIISCTKNDFPGTGDGSVDTGKTATLRVSQLSYTGSNTVLEGENTIDNMQACLFVDGVMTRVYDNLSKGESGYNLQIDSHNGTLYMIANMAGRLDLNSLLESATTETDWLKTAVDYGVDGRPVNFFTGTVDLNSPDTYSFDVKMKRGVARFDLKVDSSAQEISVKNVEITNVARKGYLITPSTGVASPDAVSYENEEITFVEPVTAEKAGFLYVYEQTNNDMQVNVTVEIAGQEKVLSKKLSGDISRNNVYTVTVRKNDIDIYVNVNIEDWENGSDTEIEA